MYGPEGRVGEKLWLVPKRKETQVLGWGNIFIFKFIFDLPIQRCILGGKIDKFGRKTFSKLNSVHGVCFFKSGHVFVSGMEYKTNNSMNRHKKPMAYGLTIGRVFASFPCGERGGEERKIMVLSSSRKWADIHLPS